MKSLGKSLSERIYYVNNTVIYNIGPIVQNPDSHGVIITKNEDNKIEKLFVNSDKFYLDVFIEDGDKYASNSFTKTVHENDGGGSSTMTYFEYYKLLCEKEIRNGIIQNSGLTYKELVVDGNKIGKFFSRLGVPEYMVEQTRAICGTTVKTGKTGTGTAATVINLTEDVFNEWKKEEAAKIITDTAENKASQYGFKFTEDIEDYIKGKLTNI